jgi:predicted ester cyclase
MSSGRNGDRSGSVVALAVAGAAAGGALAAIALRKRHRHARSPAHAKLIARWVIEEPWKENWHVIDRHVSPTYVGHDLAEAESLPGPAALRANLERYVQAFPDGRVTVEDQIAEGDTVTSRWTLRGTQTGELAGIAPTGKQVTVSGMTISRIDGDLVAEEWMSWDRLGMLIQLGAVSEPAHA